MGGCEDPECGPPPSSAGCWDVQRTGTCPRGGAPACKWCNNGGSSSQGLPGGKGKGVSGGKNWTPVPGKSWTPVSQPAFDKKKSGSKGSGAVGKASSNVDPNDPT